MKTSELTGAALDWAVAKCEYGNDVEYIYARTATRNAYSSDWSQGGPIIEREKLSPSPADFGLFWRCYSFGADGMNNGVWECGPTPLIAAMRCYVASRLGDEVQNETI